MWICWWQKSNMHYKLLAERPRSIIPLQWNPSFRQMLDQVHFSCRGVCSKVTKYDVHILWLSMMIYELYEWPSYYRLTVRFTRKLSEQATAVVWWLPCSTKLNPTWSSIPKGGGTDRTASLPNCEMQPNCFSYWHGYYWQPIRTYQSPMWRYHHWPPYGHLFFQNRRHITQNVHR